MGERIPTEEVKKIELSILDYISRVCKENDIKFFLAYGTLLGAIRHRGFIPWDDDIDIYMQREDYMKFIKLLSSKQDDRYKLLSIYNDENYLYEFAKVVDSKTVLEVNNVLENNKEGVWVDIFPLDSVSSALKIQKGIINFFVACRILSVYKQFPSEKRSKAFYPLWFVSRIVGPRFFLRMTEKLALRGRNDEMVGYMASMGVSHFYFPKKWCDKICLVEFEGRQYPAFEQYDEYLKYQYGDYKQLPPEDKRHAHPVVAYWRQC